MFQRVSDLSLGEVIVYAIPGMNGISYNKGEIDSIDFENKVIHFIDGHHVEFENRDIEFYVVKPLNLRKFGCNVKVGDIILHHNKWKLVKDLRYAMQEYGMIEVYTETDNDKETFYIYYDAEYKLQILE